MRITSWAPAAVLLAPLAGRALEAGSKFALYALAARAMGGAQAGGFFLCLGVIHFTATAARLGLERPLTRHVASERAAGHPDRARHIMWSGVATIGAASLGASLLLSCLAPVLATRLFHTPGLASALVISALILPLQNTAYGSAYVLIGLGRAGAAQMVMNAIAPTLALVAIVCGVRRLEELLIAYALAFGLCAGVGLYLMAKASPKLHAALREPTGPVLAALFASARPLFVVELAQAALLSLPVVIIGYAASGAEVSAFAIANRLTMLVTTVVISIGAVAAPAFAAHHRREDWAGLRQANERAFQMSARFCLPLIAGLALGAAPLLRFLGAGALGAVQAMWILLVGQLVFCLLPCRDTLLAMTGHGAVLRRLSLVQLAACIGLTLWLTPIFGIRGAAAASAVVWIAGAVGCAFAARPLLGDHPS